MGTFLSFVFFISLIGIIYGVIKWRKANKNSESIKKPQIITLVSVVVAVISLVLFPQSDQYKQISADRADISSSKSISKDDKAESKSISKAVAKSSKQASKSEKASSKQDEKSSKLASKAASKSTKVSSKLAEASSKREASKEDKSSEKSSSVVTKTTPNTDNIGKAINDSLAENRQFYKNGNKSYDYVQYIDTVDYSNKQATVNVTPAFNVLAEDAKNSFATSTKGMIEAAILMSDEDTFNSLSNNGIYTNFKYGKIVKGHSELSDHAKFKWN